MLPSNRRTRRSYPLDELFAGRYKATLIDADEYLAAMVRYIHLNALEAGIVKMPADYRWASHGGTIRQVGKKEICRADARDLRNHRETRKWLHKNGAG